MPQVNAPVPFVKYHPSRPPPEQQTPIHSGYHSPGAWIGLAVCVFICIAWVLRYSYLASPFWFLRVTRWLGIRPSHHTPISHQPICVERGTRAPSIRPPEPAHVRLDPKQTLPFYKPTSRFSSDVLDALARLEPVPGGRPPSYRSKLSTELRRAMERALKEDEEAGKHQGQ